ncbi:hypothetical protein FD723_21505 [Nostoc sp. C052]|uniref:hypothetical protein n=1 Tax=Nostoc sp. C052 TaxID=2576902 RepID=UPI0015C3AB37|nr:hypothetical protein [Nostoc sp. C052]QLE42757.1 hypothetical protein FD723_21505 [Nostoc sp. C052]
MINSDLEIINSMVEYMHNFLEKPHRAFGNMPICPFVEKARLQNNILYHIYRFSPNYDLNLNSHLIKLIDDFRTSISYEVMLIIHPDQQAMTLNESQHFVKHLNEIISGTGLTAFAGNSDDKFNIQGVYTRQAPYIHLTIQTDKSIKIASELLLKTRYYQNWSAENLKYVGFPRK